MAATEEKYRLDREIIAMRVAKELQDGDVVNLGIGIPSLCSQFVPEGRDVLYHSESGVMNFGPMAEPGDEDVDLTNASGHFLAWHPGMSFFHSADAFAMIRGGAHRCNRAWGAASIGVRRPRQLDAAGARRWQCGRRDGPRRWRAARHRRDGTQRPQRRIEGRARVHIPAHRQRLRRSDSYRHRRDGSNRRRLGAARSRARLDSGRSASRHGRHAYSIA